MKKTSFIRRLIPFAVFALTLVYLLHKMNIFESSFENVAYPVGTMILCGITLLISGFRIVMMLIIEPSILHHTIEAQRETIIELRNDNGDAAAAAAAQMNAQMNNFFGGMMQSRGNKDKEEAEKALFTPVDVGDITMDDIRGLSETKKDIMEVIDILKRSDELEAIGGSAPSGLLLCGGPGVGKTMMAKAIAGTCGMKFIPVSGSAFVDKYVGEGASRVRKLFDKAREAAKKDKVIIFIDEIDALCGARGNDSSAERDATLNQFLCELDGFANRKNIFVIAATNREELLDEAVTRPGRLDRTITVPMPDKADRKDILGHYMRKYKLAENVSLEKLVNKTVGFSPAELKNLLNTAAISAVCDEKKFIDNSYLDEAFWKIIMKGNKKDSERSFEEDQLVAYHEAGHALINTLIENEEVTEVTIVGSTSGAGGVTMIAPKEQVVRSAETIRAKIMGLYGGRAAEEVLLGNTSKITTGASSDIQQATKYIKSYLEKWGMNGNGLLDYSIFKKDGDSLQDAKELSEQLYRETVEVMKRERSKLDALAGALLEKRTLDGDEVRSILNGETVVEPIDECIIKV